MTKKELEAEVARLRARLARVEPIARANLNRFVTCLDGRRRDMGGNPLPPEWAEVESWLRGL